MLPVVLPLPLLLGRVPASVAALVLFAMELDSASPLATVPALFVDLTAQAQEPALELCLSDSPAVVDPAFRDLSVKPLHLAAVGDSLSDLPPPSVRVVALSNRSETLPPVPAVRDGLGNVPLSGVRVIAFFHSREANSLLATVRLRFSNVPLSSASIVAFGHRSEADAPGPAILRLL